jgi:hypothetical protein
MVPMMPESVTYVSGLTCYLCPRSVPLLCLTALDFQRVLAADERLADARYARVDVTAPSRSWRRADEYAPEHRTAG